MTRDKHTHTLEGKRQAHTQTDTRMHTEGKGGGARGGAGQQRGKAHRLTFVVPVSIPVGQATGQIQSIHLRYVTTVVKIRP